MYWRKFDLYGFEHMFPRFVGYFKPLIVVEEVFMKPKIWKSFFSFVKTFVVGKCSLGIVFNEILVGQIRRAST